MSPAVEFAYLRPINYQRCQNFKLWSLVVSIEKRIIARELWLAAARPGDIVKPIWFLLLVISMVPLALTPDSELLAEIGSAMIWIATLLALLLNSEHFFQSDFSDGVLEQWLFFDRPLAWLVGLKLTAHWLLHVLPLILISPVIALTLSVPGDVSIALFITMLVATPALTCFSGLGAALTLGSSRSGILGVLVMMPLFVPVVVLASGVLIRAMDGSETLPLLALLGAFSVASAVLVPIAVSLAIRVNIGGSN
ncbi:MAG TPA: heme exporter protein CcmB [Gammaproteobacteria bacterium]|nr:heme exporter protein CcmB [Gammaproteobacteria bacterium]HBX26790.1 heme exporter protein CcmB [Gammaproteobacteria bacterium]